MQMRERDGLVAMVSIESTGDASCRLWMAVAEEGRPVWTSVRDVSLIDADCTTIERTALEATSAIADHLRRRQRRSARPR
ncbi:MAG: hypothetical protein ABIS17_15770 [Casimicrobiaceae bacterium]